MTLDVSALRAQAEYARTRGSELYEKLLPMLKSKQLDGQYIGINAESGAWVVANSRADLIDMCKEEFGGTPGWVQRISYDEPNHRLD
jgi:hypothetical protein